jgi:OOP family OmpA-OmpF porin
MKIRLTQTKLAVAMAAALFAAPASAGLTGYLTASGESIVKSGSGLCWHTSAWTPEHAVEPCDAVPRANVVAPIKVAAAEPKPEPRPAPPPVAVAEPAPPVAIAGPAPLPPPAPVIQRLSLSTELLFEFDSDRLRPQGQEKLRELAKSLKGAELQSLSAVGHADRIGAQRYNRGLSERRAGAVREYLSELGIETKRIDIAGRGESEPITGGACRGLRGNALILCLQPDRRVDIEVRGSRTVQHQALK